MHVCNNIKISDLKNVNFRNCEEDEDPFEDKCFPLVESDKLTQLVMDAAMKGLNTEIFDNQVAEEIGSELNGN